MQPALQYLGTVLLSAAWLSACAVAPPPVVTTSPPPEEPVAVAPEAPQEDAAPEEKPRFTQIGVASWYGRGFHHKPTASGELFDMFDVTAAHRSLPLATVVHVTNLDNGKAILVRINDRGPYRGGRVIDLSRQAARLLDMQEDGLARVRIEVFDSDQPEEIYRRSTAMAPIGG